MNLGHRDTVHDRDRVQPFAYVSVIQSRAFAGEFDYCVETRGMDGVRPTVEWIRQFFVDPREVVRVIVAAFAYADVPPRSSRI